jgi:hypothetical protein
MSDTQFLPIPPEMYALATETVSRRVSRLPFLRTGVNVTGELVSVTLECLNAEFKKALPLTTPKDAAEDVGKGLDFCLEQRLKQPGKTIVPVIAEVLCSAGIAEQIELLDRQLHRPRKAIQLLPTWTWHIASTVPAGLPGSTDDESQNLAWMRMCPVCRTGILNRVTGKQLFGIPHTDFYVECTHCGAKFIPVGTQFRLVSIATIRDPLWKKHLDKTYPPDTWAGLARGSRPGGSVQPKVVIVSKLAGDPGSAPRTVGVAARTDVPALRGGGLAQLKDGSFAVPFGEKILYYKPMKLNFFGNLKDDLFARSDRLLQDILEKPAYAHLNDPVNAKYPQYLPMKVGLFLGQLKERHDPFYRQFLNQHGDERYGTFRVEESNEAGRKGVLIAIANRGIYAAVECPESFRTTINDSLGRITAEDCFLEHDSLRCRINALLCTYRKESGLYVYASEKEDERVQVTEALKKQAII